MPTAVYKILEEPALAPAICNDCNVNTNSKSAIAREFLSSPLSFGITFTTNLQRTFLRFNLAQPISGTPPPKGTVITSAILRVYATHTMDYVFDTFIRSVNPVQKYTDGTLGSTPLYPSCPTLSDLMTENPSFPRYLWEWGDLLEEIYSEKPAAVGPTTGDWFEIDVTELVSDLLARDSYAPDNLSVRDITDDEGNLIGQDFLYNNLCLRLDEGNAADYITPEEISWYQRIAAWNASYPAEANPGAELIITYEFAPVTLTVNSSPPPVSITVVETGETLTTPAVFSLSPTIYNIKPEEEVVVDMTTYRFLEWEDGSTVNPRTINLTGDLTITAYYMAVTAIEGYIRDVDTGVAIEGATVTIVETGASVLTDVNGYYIVEVLGAGTYTVEATAVGYEPASTPVTVAEGETTTQDFSLTSTIVEHTLTITSSAGGTTTPASGAYTYTEGDVAIVTAIADSGYMFHHWELDSAYLYVNPINITMDMDYMLHAVFVPIPTYTLDIVTTTGGNTTPSPGSYTYNEGDVAIVTAIPDSGYTFDHWELDGVNVGATNPIDVTMDTNHTLTAYFTAIPPPEYTLMIESTAGGTTSPAPGDYSYIQGTTVTITAIPDAGYAFDYWLLDGVQNTTNPIRVLMDKNHALAAYFEALPPPEYTLTIASGAGGTTDPTPDDYTHVAGTTVNVTAIPDTDYNFDHWELDGITYTSNPINIIMDRYHSLTAYFTEIPPQPPDTFNLTISSSAGGTLNPTPGIYEYDEGTTVTVTATPANGYYFNHWELDGAVKLENPINVLMDKDHTLLAVFTSEPPPEPPPETPFEEWWNSFVELLESVGLPVPPKPPAPPLPSFPE